MRMTCSKTRAQRDIPSTHGVSIKLRQILCGGKSFESVEYSKTHSSKTNHSSIDFCTRHAIFYVSSSKELMKTLKFSASDLPTVFMVSNDGEGILRYSGEILELNLSEWVLRNSSPAMDELTVATNQGPLHPLQLLPLLYQIIILIILLYYCIYCLLFF